MIKHIVSLSGGKDSTAMLLRMLELRMQVDDIVWFDCGNWEFPQMKNHIQKIENYISRKITVVKDRKGFDYWAFEHKFTRGPRKGKQIGYGFPSVYRRYCTRQKVAGLDKLLKENIVYIGYAVDEKNRLNKLIIKSKKYQIKYPLIDWKWTEKDCLEYCYSKGFDWDGLYKLFRRVSCWCCPLQRIEGLRRLRKHFPVLWERLLRMQEKLWNSFRIDGTTVFDLENRFRDEDRQFSLGI